MRVLNLKADNFKALKAIEISPEGNVVVVGGKNGQGKSSVMDAIWVALKGRSAAPPKPIRTGEEECTIVVDLGELRVSRKFTAKEGGTYTDSVKVENSEGLRYSKPQEVLDALLGAIGFDPLDFARMKPEKQAETLLAMVPLTVDLDDLAEADRSDYDNRRDTNRDANALKAQIDAMPKEEVPADAPDREALVAKLGEAADTNGRIERERLRREQIENAGPSIRAAIARHRDRAAVLRAEADAADEEAARLEAERDKVEKELAALPPLEETVDTDAVRRQLHEAEATLAAIDRQKRRAVLVQQHETLVKRSEGYTAAMEKREKDRQEALKAAEMPIESLSFEIDEKGRPNVYLNGVPFEQASTAEKLAASTKIGMQSNPELRVMRISDGSLLDEDTMAMLRGMAESDDFQLWVEVVGDPGAVGIVMENGEVRAAEPKAEAKPKAAAKAKADGALL